MHFFHLVSAVFCFKSYLGREELSFSKGLCGTECDGVAETSEMLIRYNFRSLGDS